MQNIQIELDFIGCCIHTFIISVFDMLISTIKKMTYLLCMCILVCSCVDSHIQTKVSSGVKSKFPLDTTVRFEFARHCAYGYTLAWPKEFKEQIDTIGQVDSIVLLSPKNDAILKYFVEGEVKRDDTTRDFLFAYLQQIERGEHPLAIGCKIIQSTIMYNKIHTNFRGHFVIIGEIGQKEFVWKTVLSEVPISGDLTYKSMLFTYNKEQKKYYQPIGLFLADKFGDHLSSQPKLNPSVNSLEKLKYLASYRQKLRQEINSLNSP